MGAEGETKDEKKGLRHGLEVRVRAHKGIGRNRAGITLRTVGVSFARLKPGRNLARGNRASRFKYRPEGGEKRNRREAEAKRDVTVRSFRIPIIQRKQKSDAEERETAGAAVSGSERD